MRSLPFTHFLIALLACAVFACAADDAPPPGFTALFNGRDLKGWRGGDTFDPRKLLAMNPVVRGQQIEKWSIELTIHWRAENGELVSNGVGRHLTTERDFGDFELRGEYRLEARGDSGLYLRGVPQVQLWDSADPQLAKQGADKGSGGLWNNTPGTPGRDPLVRADKPAGEWNQVRVVMVGSRVSVWLNARLVVDHARLENYFDRSQPVPAKGPIQLQTHGGEMRWRRLFLRELPGADANAILAEHGRDAGFKPLWNGRDAAGWAGVTGAYEVVNGTIRCKADRAGTMYFHEELKDFVARLEFASLAGGSCGLALRYPGAGEATSAGLCMIPLRDERYEKTRGPIDARQAHGSAYGLVAAARGYQRPLGEWNFQEVTVRGSTVRVELNGNVILNADLATVTPAAYLRGGMEKWSVRPSGYLGLVGEGPGLALRRLEIKPLPALR